MRIRSVLCASALVAGAGLATAVPAMAAGEPAGDCHVTNTCPVGNEHPNAGRGNGSEFLGTKVDQDPGNSAGHNNGGD
jgi:hypothetical protein